MASYKKSHSEEEGEESRRKKSLRREEGKVMEAPGGEMAPPSPVAGDPVALLTSPQMAHPANAPLRAQAVTELQRQRGNVYVQQVIKRIQAEKGSGRPLDPGVREFMEPSFGYDFDSVRVHTDSFAAKTARDLGAEAFTIGKDVFFGAGKYNPGPKGGQKLIAHELTHIIQQNQNLEIRQIQTKSLRIALQETESQEQAKKTSYPIPVPKTPFAPADKTKVITPFLQKRKENIHCFTSKSELLKYLDTMEKGYRYNERLRPKEEHIPVIGAPFGRGSRLDALVNRIWSEIDHGRYGGNWEYLCEVTPTWENVLIAISPAGKSPEEPESEVAEDPIDALVSLIYDVGISIEHFQRLVSEATHHVVVVARDHEGTLFHVLFDRYRMLEPGAMGPWTITPDKEARKYLQE